MLPLAIVAVTITFHCPLVHNVGGGGVKSEDEGWRVRSEGVIGVKSESVMSE